MSEAAHKVLQRWLSAVNSGDLEGVLSLYDKEAMLLPTFSEEVRLDAAAIRDYFVTVSSNDEVAVELVPDSLVTQDLGRGLFSLGGLYDWHFVNKGERRSCRARFTFTLDPGRERPILHHHSSELPES